MLCAVIMAGGRGERFWPLSTDERPKQFLNLIGNKSMIQMTVDRLKGLIPIERIFIVTGEIYEHLVKEQLPEIPERNIIMEPVGRNTAPCIALSAMYIKKFYKDAVIAVLPSDHLIKDDKSYMDILSRAEKFVDRNPKSIVTIGITPDRPETGYGYIKFTEDSGAQENSIEDESYVAFDMDDSMVKPVERFVEKPSIDKALEYMQNKSYLWNAGMFIWNVNNVIALTKRYLPDTYEILSSIDMSSLESFKKDCEEKYPSVENISVDYGIMEKAENIYVIPGDFGWDDVGSWFAVERYSKKDDFNNVFKGEVKSIQSKDNMIISTNKPIIVVGADNLLVVESDDVIFVSSKEYIGNLKDIKKQITK